MIVRILGEGQFDVPAAETDELNRLDGELQVAVDAGEQAGFRAALAALLDRVRSAGSRLPGDALVPSDLVLPAADTDVSQVRGMLSDEGLIPG